MVWLSSMFLIFLSLRPWRQLAVECVAHQFEYFSLGSFFTSIGPLVGQVFEEVREDMDPRATFALDILEEAAL